MGVMFPRLTKKSPRDLLLGARLRASLGPAVIEGRCRVHQQHRRGEDHRTNEKSDVTMVEGCEKENWGAVIAPTTPIPWLITFATSGWLIASSSARAALVKAFIPHDHATHIERTLPNKKIVAC